MLCVNIFFSELSMKTRLILKPGQRGTKRLTEQYGDKLAARTTQ